MSITKLEILMGRDTQYAKDYTPEISANIDSLLIALNKFRAIYDKPMTVSSGWRPASLNAKVPGAAKKSNHIIGLACDFKDSDGALDAYCLANQDVLKECGLYLEHPDNTPGWCHLQSISPKSGNRTFKP